APPIVAKRCGGGGLPPSSTGGLIDKKKRKRKNFIVDHGAGGGRPHERDALTNLRDHRHVRGRGADRREGQSLLHSLDKRARPAIGAAATVILGGGEQFTE